MGSSEWIAVGTAIATFAGAIAAFLALSLQIRKMNQQLMIQYFADYTKRYQEIVLHLPESINEPTFSLSASQDREHLMRHLRAYFDLCFEEWYLNNRRVIDRDVWRVWHGGMRTALSRPVFQEAWSKIKQGTRFGPEFEAFIDELR